MSTGVTWTEPTEVAALTRRAGLPRDAKRHGWSHRCSRRPRLTQTVGDAMGYEYTALLFVEPEKRNLGRGRDPPTVRSSICTDSGCTALGAAPRQSTELAAMVAALDGPGVEAGRRVRRRFAGVDNRPHQAAIGRDGLDSGERTPRNRTWRSPVQRRWHRQNAPLFASSTAAVAYAQDPGTGEVNPNLLAPAYLDVSANARLG